MEEILLTLSEIALLAGGVWWLAAHTRDVEHLLARLDERVSNLESLEADRISSSKDGDDS